jgi:hypothetical protein
MPKNAIGETIEIGSTVDRIDHFQGAKGGVVERFWANGRFAEVKWPSWSRAVPSTSVDILRLSEVDD